MGNTQTTAEQGQSGPTGLSSRELATVLAALRYWQRHTVNTALPALEDAIATNEGQFVALDKGEIDDLCERLNVAAPVARIDDPAGYIARAEATRTALTRQRDELLMALRLVLFAARDGAVLPRDHVHVQALAVIAKAEGR